jgi:Na+-transporting NADH:ubiquinone oxidoreductase subunit A
MARDKLVELILAGGMWWAFRQLPFRDWSDPDKTPPLILVALGAKEPFSPQPSIYLDDRQELLEYGLAVLRVLGAGRVAVIAEEGDAMAMNLAAEQVTHLVQGCYPADDPGTVLYHIKSSAVDNRAWYIAGQDLLLVAALLQQGRYPIERVICVGGGAAAAPRHYRTRLGVPLAHLAGQRQPAQDVRYIVGGMLRGFSGSAAGFMGLYETALNILPAEGRAEFLALFRPGSNKPTYSRTFASRLNPAALPFDCLLHGEERACIACLHCTEVCAVDIMPLMAYKALLADEIEEALAHGLLDCVECGLCSYVCPSKIELTQTFIAAKAAYAKERAE